MSTLAVGTIKSVSSAPPLFKNSSGTEKGILVKKFVNFNGQGTVSIRDSFGVSSITDNGTGHYTVNFDGNMSNNDYSASIECGGGGHNGWCPAFGSGDSDNSFFGTGEMEFNTRGGDGSGGSVFDPNTCCVIVTGDN